MRWRARKPTLSRRRTEVFLVPPFPTTFRTREIATGHTFVPLEPEEVRLAERICRRVDEPKKHLVRLLVAAFGAALAEGALRGDGARVRGGPPAETKNGEPAENDDDDRRGDEKDVRRGRRPSGRGHRHERFPGRGPQGR